MIDYADISNKHCRFLQWVVRAIDSSDGSCKRSHGRDWDKRLSLGYDHNVSNSRIMLLQLVDSRQMVVQRESENSYNKKVNVCFYIAMQVSSSLNRSKRFTLLLPWQTCSFRHQPGFSWKHSSHAAITRNDYSLVFPPPSIARYSFRQLSELGRHGENENCQTSKR